MVLFYGETIYVGCFLKKVSKVSSPHLISTSPWHASPWSLDNQLLNNLPHVMSAPELPHPVQGGNVWVVKVEKVQHEKISHLFSGNFRSLSGSFLETLFISIAH